MATRYATRFFFAFAGKLVILRDRAAHDALYSQEDDLCVAHWLTDARDQGLATEVSLLEETAARPIAEVITKGSRLYIVHCMPEEVEDLVCGPDKYVPLLLEQHPTTISVL